MFLPYTLTTVACVHAHGFVVSTCSRSFRSVGSASHVYWIYRPPLIKIVFIDSRDEMPVIIERGSLLVVDRQSG